VGLTHVFQFLVEDAHKKNGGDYPETRNWEPYVVVHGRLITGENPASSESAACALVSILSNLDEPATLASSDGVAAWVLVERESRRRLKPSESADSSE
jgi:hypothetical protein